ncbi:hypothetical protein DXG01_004488 [Tephrocybe rancida]|nr:hypothetical protein DXG01_004488 [Tephrocybe rancida]
MGWISSGTVGGVGMMMDMTQKDIFIHEIDNQYNTANRFENHEGRIQGQLHDIKSITSPALFAQLMGGDKDLISAFCEGMNQQHSNTSTCLRRGHDIFGVEKNIMQDHTERGKAFRTKLGWDEGTQTYNTTNIELLHTEDLYRGKYNKDTAFRSKTLMSPTIMLVFTALIRGLVSGEKMKDKEFSHPTTSTMEAIHGITNTTPGDIATTATFAIWVLSGDPCLQRKGQRTKRNYMTLYNNFLQILMTGLRNKRQSIYDVINDWDRTIFLDTETSIVASGGGVVSSGLHRALLDQEEEGEEEGVGSGGV